MEENSPVTPKGVKALKTEKTTTDLIAEVKEAQKKTDLLIAKLSDKIEVMQDKVESIQRRMTL